MTAKRGSRHPRIATLIDMIPLAGPWSAADREQWFTSARHDFNLVFGVVEPQAYGGPAGGGIASSGQAQQGVPLYVIKADGSAYCDGKPMALRDLPADCTFHDKRGEIDDAKHAWQTIVWADVGAAPPTMPRPSGLKLQARQSGGVIRSTSEEEAGVLT